MKAAIGIGTRTIYATGKDKEECFRKLSVLYPSFKKNTNENKGRASTVLAELYPEPLKIVNVRR